MPGFCGTVFDVKSVLLFAVNLYCVPSENGLNASENASPTTWFAKPVPVTSIGVPPMSGPAGRPAVGPAVAVTPVTDGIPAYVAFRDPESPAIVWTVTGTFSVAIVVSASGGATIWISVPLTLTRSKVCESAFVESPKLTHLRPARFRPVPLMVTTLSPFSLASENGPALVEIDVIVGGGK